MTIVETKSNENFDLGFNNIFMRKYISYHIQNEQIQLKLNFNYFLLFKLTLIIRIQLNNLSFFL